MASSGVGLGEVIKKIEAALPDRVRIIDIEDRLCDFYKTRELLGKRVALAERPSMYLVTFYLTRKEISELWHEVIKQAVSDLATSREEFRLLCGHVLYFGDKRKEFYSVIKASLLKFNGVEFKRVALLTDDIYDMYSRLLYSGELFNSLRLRGFISKLVDDNRVSDAKSWDIGINSRYCMEWEMSEVWSKLFSWRQIETVMAENLAIQTGGDFMLWGVKQSVESLRAWLSGSKSVYLSHSISEARRRKNNGEDWQQFTSEVNGIHRLALQSGFSCINPTAIDELRFEQRRELVDPNQEMQDKDPQTSQEGIPSKNEDTVMPEQIKVMTGNLTSRWPLVDKLEALMYVKPSDPKAPEYSDLFLPKYWSFETQRVERVPTTKYSDTLATNVDYFVSNIKNLVSAQIPLRDHLLVSHSNALFIYRPHWNSDGEFSGGVAAEVQHWSIIASDDRRAAFIHMKEDIEGMTKVLKSKDANGLSNKLRVAVGRQLRAIVGDEHVPAALNLSTVTFTQKLQW